ncbi:MAG: hypothetical protein WCR67_00105 [Bacilli bacterium]
MESTEKITKKGPSWFKRFKREHPVLVRNIWQFAKFGLIGWALTIIQYLGYTFLPQAFGIEYAAIDWQWPKIELPYGDGKFYWTIIGYDVLKDAEGNAIIGGGLGYTLSWIIVYFATQIINFPLQRNITYKSKGNIGYQILWYFIALVLVTLTSNALNSLWIKAASEVLPATIYQIAQTLATSGVSTVVFFFVFKIIFPEGKPDDQEVKKRILDENLTASILKGIFID